MHNMIMFVAINTLQQNHLTIPFLTEIGPGVAKPVEHFPEGLIEAMIPNDFEFAANNRARILKEWQSRYDGKSDPK